MGALAVFVLHGQDFGSHHSSPSRAASAFEVLLGCLILIGSVVAYRRRKPSKGGASTPKWLDRVEGTHWLLAIAVGAVMLSYALSLAAASEILKANVSRLDASVAVVVFALTSIVTVAAPIVIVLVAPERSARTLAAWKAWLLCNSRAVVLVVADGRRRRSARPGCVRPDRVSVLRAARGLQAAIRGWRTPYSTSPMTPRRKPSQG